MQLAKSVLSANDWAASLAYLCRRVDCRVDFWTIDHSWNMQSIQRIVHYDWRIVHVHSLYFNFSISKHTFFVSKISIRFYTRRCENSRSQDLNYASLTENDFQWATLNKVIIVTMILIYIYNSSASRRPPAGVWMLLNFSIPPQPAARHQRCMIWYSYSPEVSRFSPHGASTSVPKLMRAIGGFL